MKSYNNYNLPCPLISSSSEPKSFIRSTFDYGHRQRRALRDTIKYKFNILVNYTEALSFQSLWLETDYGTDSFLVDFQIHLDTSSSKEVRFINNYSIQELNYNMYRISTDLELLNTGYSLIEQCPLEPQITLIIEEGATPC